jgi:hypothetical protein
MTRNVEKQGQKKPNESVFYPKSMIRGLPKFWQHKGLQWKTGTYAMAAGRLLAQFRISTAMHPYVLRLRLRGSDFDFGATPERAAAFTKSIGEMRRLLLEKDRIPTMMADRAIQKTLEAAFDFQLADLRYRSLRAIEAHSHATLDYLIRELRELAEAIARLPPNSKGQLNKRVFTKIDQAPFDSEVFIDIIETIAQTLPEIGPRRLTNNILSLIHPDPGTGRRSHLIDAWEAMPAATRVKVETMVQDNRSRLLVTWLADVAHLLEQERPIRKRGAPRAVSRVFVSRIARIWRTLGLKVGLAYDFFLHPANDERIGRGGRVQSRFQCYCRAALTAVGDPTEISARQVVNYKKNTGATRSNVKL